MKLGLPGGRRQLLTGVVAVAALAMIAVSVVRHRDPELDASPSSPDRSSSAVPARVEVESTMSWRTYETSKDFVVHVALTNHSQFPVRVQAAATPEHPGFNRLVVAVLPGAMAEGDLSYDEVTAAGRSPVTLARDETAELTIAGRVSCGTPMLTHDGVDILVDGQPGVVTLPSSPEGDWAATARALC